MEQEWKRIVKKRDGWYTEDGKKLGFPEDKEDGEMRFRIERIPITAIWSAYQNDRIQRACTNDKRSSCCVHRRKDRPLGFLCPIRDSIKKGSLGWYVNEEDFSKKWIWI